MNKTKNPRCPYCDIEDVIFKLENKEGFYVSRCNDCGNEYSVIYKDGIFETFEDE